MTKKIESREYKVMLVSERLSGNEAALLLKANELWSHFTDYAMTHDIAVQGDFNEIRHRRYIRFYDTAANELDREDYIFRERQVEGSGDREVTLKFRSKNCSAAAAKQMQAANPAIADEKFEEDLKLPFKSLYSHSCTQPLDGRLPRKVNEIALLYPGLHSDLDKNLLEKPLHIVGNFTARERVIRGAKLKLSKNPKVKAKCALVIWYAANGDIESPLVGEFSFRYKTKNEQDDESVKQSADDLFKGMSNHLAEWIDRDGMTKTRYVYSRNSPVQL